MPGRLVVVVLGSGSIAGGRAFIDPRRHFVQQPAMRHFAEAQPLREVADALKPPSVAPAHTGNKGAFGLSDDSALVPLRGCDPYRSSISPRVPKANPLGSGWYH